MTPQDLIERYVQAVARRLPRRMRADVATELRTLITDSVNERAAGRAPDEQTVSDYLVALGAPAALALSYCAPPVIVEPRDAPLFTKLASGLLIALAVLAASVILAAPHEASNDWQAIAASVTNQYLIAALQVLGLLLVVFWLLGAARRRHLWLAAWTPRSLPAIHDPDQVNRAGYIAALAAWSLGFLVLMQPVAAFDLLFGGQAPEALRHAFTYDETFSRARAPVLWSLLAASLILFAWATIEGRWRKLTRQLELVASMLICIVSVWVILAGDIFQAAQTDQTMKFGMALTAGFSAIEVWRQIREERMVRAPAHFIAPLERL